MALSTPEEKSILCTIWKSLKDPDRRDEFKSGNSSRNRSYGSSKSEDSNYGSDNGGSQTKYVKYEQECYAILGISRTVTQSEIKKSYMKLSKEHHPGGINNQSQQSIHTLMFNCCLCR